MKKKVVLVDGASLLHMAKSLDIRRISFPGLFRVLQKEIGATIGLRMAPIITLPPNIAIGMAKALKISKFDLRPCHSFGGRDDRLLIQKIEELDPKRVSEIVLVSSDSDFIPALAQKARQGIPVYVVAIVSGSGTSAVSKSYAHHFEGLNFTLIDLRNFAEAITLEKISTDIETVPEPQPQQMRILIEGETDAEVHTEILAFVKNLEQKYSGLRIWSLSDAK